MRNALFCKALRMEQETGLEPATFCFLGSYGRNNIAGSLDFIGLERERGFEPPTLCLGSRSGPGPLPSTRVRQSVFDRVWRRFRGS